METSHRSTTHLPRLSIGPLSSISPLENSDASTADHDSPQWPRHTYMSGRSAPTTPGILSHNGSSARLNSKSFTHLAFTTDTIGGGIGGGGGGGILPKSKSTTVLLPGLASQQQQQQRKKKIRYGGLTKAATVPTDDGEWLFRAGAAITSETRESKGQSWLVSRESSTSLVALDNDDDDETVPDRATFSPRYSRSTSRVPSTRTSRRPSGAGSRPDLNFFTPLASRTPVREMVAGHHDYFGDAIRESSSAVVAGPDFVDEQDEEEDGSDVDEELRDRLAEAEVARLAQNRGFGLGGLVDRFIGWSLFDVEDEGREREEEEERGFKGSLPESPVQAREAEVSVQQKIRGVERALAPRIAQNVVESTANVEGDDVEGQGGWSDAAWLLSVASKVLL